MGLLWRKLRRGPTWLPNQRVDTCSYSRGVPFRGNLEANFGLFIYDRNGILCLRHCVPRGHLDQTNLPELRMSINNPILIQLGQHRSCGVVRQPCFFITDQNTSTLVALCQRSHSLEDCPHFAYPWDRKQQRISSLKLLADPNTNTVSNC